jgi:DNA mismatch repair protein MutL
MTVGAIAAGEVVERPLSVVKELVENALDAGATRIVVSVARGGLEAIEVGDDGAGIDAAELQLAFARHATSKLAHAGDLERIVSLGFRGEGLASIAAVAQVRLISRTAASEVGWMVEAHGNDVSQPEPIAAPLGTRVSVRGLFANVPARREYLRAPAAEFARISTFLATLALGYPEVAFTLAHDGRTAFAFSSAERLEQRLAHVFGPSPAKALLPLDASDAGESALRVRGYVSTPGVDRVDRRMQLLFINGRLLRSTLLAGTWSSAYSTYALAGRQPFGVVFLDVPPDHVDPNVHPTKSDVRLRYPEAVHDAARRAMTAALARNATARMRETLSFAPPQSPAPGTYRSEPFDWSAPVDPSPPDHGSSGLRILAQLDATYILATDGDALVLIDQHAAHERVAYESIARQVSGASFSREPLLIPYTIELDAAEAARFEQSRDDLAVAGLEAEPFGERTYRVVATPAGYGARRFDVRAFIDALGDEIAGMAALIDRLVRCDNPMHCPHGRPTMVRIEPDAVAKMFKRL